MLRLSLICSFWIWAAPCAPAAVPWARGGTAGPGAPATWTAPVPGGAPSPASRGLQTPALGGPPAATAGPLDGAAQASGARLERRLLAMGSEWTLSIEAGDRAQALAASEAAVLALVGVERRLSTWDPSSELARALAAPLGQPIELSADCAAELSAAFRWSAVTDGAFDPRVGALVDAYDLRGRGRWPAAEEREAARRAGGQLGFDGRRIWREDQRSRLEEGGFAKGAGLDAALDALKRNGITQASLSLGGQVGLLGGAQVWVRDPRQPERPLLSLWLADGSLASSDNHSAGRVVDGRCLPHLLDPRSGLPVARDGSVSVFAPSALAADALSTGLFVLGEAGWSAVLARQPELGLLALSPTPSGWRAALCPRLLAALRWTAPGVEAVPWSAPADLPASLPTGRSSACSDTTAATAGTPPTPPHGPR